MPPTKRFRDMEQLSGGEKTVAALALLFALHSYRPSPFFVLDEVDAALDATNVARVAHYVRSRTRPAAIARRAAGGGQAEARRAAAAAEGEEEDGDGAGGDAAAPRDDDDANAPPGFQSIVISLKDAFYEKADALVGVCRDPGGASSRTFTFSLEPYGEPAPAE
jgi:structural maintenance of chromosome 1